MTIIDRAKDELKRIKFGDEDSAVMIEILEKFFAQWDSGGAVHAVAPVLQRLIAGKCLSPLIGDDDEWCDVSDSIGRTCWQNKRVSSVFREEDGEGKVWAYDIDAPQGRRAITFPYWPERAEVASPVVEIG